MGSNFAFTKISRTSLNLWQMVMQSQRAKKISLQKNKVYANYCNRNQHHNRAGLAEMADSAVQLVHRRGPGHDGDPANSLR